MSLVFRVAPPLGPSGGDGVELAVDGGSGSCPHDCVLGLMSPAFTSSSSQRMTLRRGAPPSLLDGAEALVSLLVGVGEPGEDGRKPCEPRVTRRPARRGRAVAARLSLDAHGAAPRPAASHPSSTPTLTSPDMLGDVYAGVSLGGRQGNLPPFMLCGGASPGRSRSPHARNARARRRSQMSCRLTVSA